MAYDTNRSTSRATEFFALALILAVLATIALDAYAFSTLRL